MLLEAILTLTIGLLLPIMAIVAMPIFAFSAGRDRLMAALAYFSCLLAQLLMLGVM